jgi:hypothetical protein
VTRVAQRFGLISASFLCTLILLALFYGGWTEAFGEETPVVAPRAGEPEVRQSAEQVTKPGPERPGFRLWNTLPEVVDLSRPVSIELGKPTALAKEKDGGEFVAAPVPLSNPSIGSGLTVIGAYIYKPNKEDKASPPWVTGGGGFYADSESWGAAVIQQAYLDEDRWRILGGLGTAHLNYKFFGIGTNAGKGDFSIPLTQNVNGGVAEVLRRVTGDFFVGVRYQIASLRTSIDLQDLSSRPGRELPSPELQTRTASLGLHIQRDSRDNQFSPTSGSLVDLRADFSGKTWGGDIGYQAYSIAYNKYSTLREGHTLAFRGYSRFTGGDVPFFGLSLFGLGSDLRGYPTGQYRDRMMLATQLEYRLHLFWRLGMVAFAGVGEVAPDVGAMTVKNLLPSAGAGLRCMIAKENGINLRVDFAVGRKTSAFYVGMGEAF